MMLGQRADSSSVAIINKDLGRDLPLYIQFLMFVNDLSPISLKSLDSRSRHYLDPSKYSHVWKIFTLNNNVIVLKPPYLGRSYQTKRNVGNIISEKIRDTSVLAISAILIAAFLGILLGTLASLKKNSFTDRFIIAFSLTAVSIPPFFASIIFAWVFGYLLHHYTGLNMTGGLYEIDPFNGIYIQWKNLILPAIVLGLRPMAIIVQLVRNSMLDVLSQDYIRTARSKGLRPRVIILRHALRNAMNPVVTSISGGLGSLLAGAVFIEYIFGWNGIGKLTVNALENYDLPVVTGIVLIISIVFVVLNIVANIINGLLVPGIRLSS
jgi:peptide/nickel transport system permease protein